MSLGNRIATTVLSSPLHRLLSGSLLVLTYEGRRTGRTYRVPLQFIDDGGSLFVWAGSASEKTWWRNFAAPEAVVLHLRGRRIPAKAALVADAGRREELLRHYLHRYPYTTPTGRPKFFGKSWQPSPAELDTVARSIVMVRFEPT